MYREPAPALATWFAVLVLGLGAAGTWGAAQRDTPGAVAPPVPVAALAPAAPSSVPVAAAPAAAVAEPGALERALAGVSGSGEPDLPGPNTEAILRGLRPAVVGLRAPAFSAPSAPHSAPLHPPGAGVRLRLEPQPVELDLGSGSDDDVRRTLQQGQEPFNTCTFTPSRDGRALTGTVLLGWEVIGGRVAGVHLVRNSVGDPELGHCLRHAVRRLRFDPDVNGTVHSYGWRVTAADAP